jgi:hypothetical protein
MSVVFCVGCGSPDAGVAKPKSAYYWMMPNAVPDTGVRFWVPVYSPHSECDQAKWTPAAALITAYTTQMDVDEHKAHYHLLNTEYGFIFQGYGGKEGEREQRISTDHFHGFYIDVEPAKKLITSAMNYQHGARE